MKKSLAILLIAVLLVGLISPIAIARTFADVPTGEWFSPYVQWANENAIMQGTGGGNFSPHRPMTRGQLVTMLWRMAGEPSASGNHFVDVAIGRFYTTAVYWAAGAGITQGVSSSHFAPYENITREQFATFLHRFAGTPTANTPSHWNHFADRGLNAPFADMALRWATYHGIVTGTNATTLSPQGMATRAQGAAMLMRFSGLGGTTPTPSPSPSPSPQPTPTPPSNGQTLDEAVRSGMNYRELLQAFPNADIQAAFEREVMRLVNRIRQDHGLAPFIHHTDLAWLARTRTDEIIRHNCLGGHVSPTTGLSHTDHAWAMGFDLDFAGEITVRGGVTPQIAVDTWMNSEPHRRSLLYDGESRLHIGVGFSHGSNHDFGTAWALWRSTPPR